MSNVPKLRFSEFSGKWEKEIFKNLVKLQRGSSPRPIVKYVTKSNDGVNWIKIGDTKSNDTYINFTGEKITKEGALKSRRVNIGDIILSNSMSYGKPYILNIDGYIHDGWFVIKEYQNHFNKSYLFQILRSEWIQKQYKRLAAGGVVSNISSELVNAVKINLPLKEEQEKIASFLTSVDTKIEQLTKKESLLQEYKKGVMQKIFNQEIRFKDDDGSEFCEWKEDKLGSYINLFSGFAFKGTDISDNSQGIPLLRGINITEGRIRHSKEIDRFFCGELDKLEKYLVKENDLVISMDGSKVGKNVALIKNIDANALLVQRVARIRENRHSNIHFIYQIIYSNYFVRYVDIVNTSSGIPHISSQQIKDFKFDFPSREEQTKIANFLSSIDKKIENTKIELEKTKEFKKALLQQMFV